MLKQGDNIVTDIRLGGVQINTVYLGAEKVYPGLLRRDVGVHYDTGANTYQGWDRYNIYYYRDVLVWSNGTQTYENLRSENTLTRANAYTEADTLKSTGTSYWRSGWDKYRTDVYQTWRTREDGHADWVGAARDVSVLVQSNAYTEAGTLKSVGTSYWRSGWDKYRTDTWQVLRTAFDGYQEWVGATWGADVLVQSNAYTEARTHKTIGTSFWPSGWDKYRTDIYQTLRTAFDGYQEWVGAEEQVPVLVENNAYTLGAYYHESSTATVCVNYGAAPYSTGYHRILARNRIRFDGYQEVNDRYTESNWQIVANNVVACGYNKLLKTAYVSINSVSLPVGQKYCYVDGYEIAFDDSGFEVTTYEKFIVVTVEIENFAPHNYRLVASNEFVSGGYLYPVTLASGGLGGAQYRIDLDYTIYPNEYSVYMHFEPI